MFNCLSPAVVCWSANVSAVALYQGADLSCFCYPQVQGGLLSQLCLLVLFAGANAWPRYNVMVASDAIGMGLNLNIRRYWLVVVCAS